MKKIPALLLALCLPGLALGETFSGQVIAAEEQQVLSPASGVLEELDLVAGQQVTEGEALGRIGVTKIFAAQDGTVSRIAAQEGELLTDEEVMSVAQVSPYLVYCTVAGSYKDPENYLVHIGETVYLKCTKDSTHLARGRVISIDGKEYHVEINAGEMYIGEAVKVFRDSEYSKDSLIGYGTVASSDDTVYTATGTVQDIRVQVGDTVEKGQLLYTVCDKAEQTVTAPVAGIVTGITRVQGSAVSYDEEIATVAASCRITFEADEEFVNGLYLGQSVTYIRADDEDETPLPGRIEKINAGGEDGDYTVTVLPEDTGLPIGLSVEVETEEQ